MKTRHCFVEFSSKYNTHNSCDLPNSCFNYLVSPQTERRTNYIFQTLISHDNFLSYLQLFIEAESKFVQFCLKFKVNWVLFLRRNVLICGYWCCAENQYSKITAFDKNSKEEYGYCGFSINPLLQHQAIY